MYQRIIMLFFLLPCLLVVVFSSFPVALSCQSSGGVQVIESTGVVVTPYMEYPQLLGMLLQMLSEGTPQARVEVLKVSHHHHYHYYRSYYHCHYHYQYHYQYHYHYHYSDDDDDDYGYCYYYHTLVIGLLYKA